VPRRNPCLLIPYRGRTSFLKVSKTGLNLPIFGRILALLLASNVT
jgi:hypothetical protein